MRNRDKIEGLFFVAAVAIYLALLVVGYHINGVRKEMVCTRELGRVTTVAERDAIAKALGCSTYTSRVSREVVKP